MEHHGSNRFFNGFLLGAMVGAAIVFLVGTEKGKKVLKLITDEGLKNISEFMEEDDLSEEVLEEVEPVEEVVETPSDLEQEPKVKKTAKKRFFRRVK